MFSHTLATRKLHITKRLVELDNHMIKPRRNAWLLFSYHITASFLTIGFKGRKNRLELYFN